MRMRVNSKLCVNLRENIPFACNCKLIKIEKSVNYSKGSGDIKILYVMA